MQQNDMLNKYLTYDYLSYLQIIVRYLFKTTF